MCVGAEGFLHTKSLIKHTCGTLNLNIFLFLKTLKVSETTVYVFGNIKASYTCFLHPLEIMNGGEKVARGSCKQTTINLPIWTFNHSKYIMEYKCLLLAVLPDWTCETKLMSASYSQPVLCDQETSRVFSNIVFLMTYWLPGIVQFLLIKNKVLIIYSVLCGW